MKPTIALFHHEPECSKDCCDGIIHSLNEHYNFKIFGKGELSEDLLKDCSVVAFPGGIGDSDSFYHFFGRRVGNVVDNFVANGGHYLGICMGAYWAGPYYFDILQGIDCVQYIKRSETDIKRSWGTTVPVTWDNRIRQMFFYDGCALIGDESKFEVIARYTNGDPAAIIQGRIGLIGPHPESEEHWYKKHIRTRWHKGEHHKLLLNFVNQLVKG